MANARTNPTEWAEILYLSSLKEHTVAQEVRIKELSEIFKPERVTPAKRKKENRPNKQDNLKKYERSKKSVEVVDPDGGKTVYKNVKECADAFDITPVTMYGRIAKEGALEIGDHTGYTFSYYKNEVQHD